MKTIIKVEEAFLFFLSVYLFSLLNFSWWWFPLLLFAPDISMIGYAANTKLGAIIYNVFHHRGFSILIYLVGVFVGLEIISLVGIILFAHSTLDRALGYGLKHFDSFKNTHLGSLQ